jgi:hypothetical protein
MFEPGQLTREAEALDVRRIEQARAELEAREGNPTVKGLDIKRRCDDCGAKLTVQVFPHGYEAHCTPCERRARMETD